MMNKAVTKKEKKKKAGPFFHRAICDVCDFPINQIRFKCSICSDYDVCAECVDQMVDETKWLSCDSIDETEEQNRPAMPKNFHPLSHLFLKIYFPLPPLYERETCELPCLYGTNIITKMGLEKMLEKIKSNAEGKMLHSAIFCDVCDIPICGKLKRKSEKKKKSICF
jgi:hypothetical protein